MLWWFTIDFPFEDVTLHEISFPFLLTFPVYFLQRWTRMSIMNTAGSCKFSSDRTIREYAKDIWNINPVELP